MTSGGPLLLEKLLPREEGWYLSAEENQPTPETKIDRQVNTALKRQVARLGYPAGADHHPAPPGIKTLKQATMDAIQAALYNSNGKIHGRGGAAELLDINPNTLRSKMRKLGMKANALPDEPV